MIARQMTTMMRTMGMGAALFAGASLVMAGCSEEPIAPREVPAEKLAKSAAPISGGTLLLMGDNALASDPDTDEVYVVDIGRDAGLLHRIAFEAGDEPGRIIEGPAGTAIVALRHGGRVAVIDVDAGEILRETDVCPEPRGMVRDGENLHVACAGGELVSLTEDAASVTRTVRLRRDLRDIVSLGGGRLAVSEFRAANVLIIDADGTLLHVEHAPDDSVADAFVGYRMREAAPGKVVMLHQMGVTRSIPIDAPPAPPEDPTPPSPYGGGSSDSGVAEGEFCSDGGIVTSAVTTFDLSGWASAETPEPGPVVTTAGRLGPLVLPVDIATEQGGNFAAIGAGNDLVFFGNTQNLREEGSQFSCSFQATRVDGMPVAVELLPGDLMVIQTRTPARIRVMDRFQVLKDVPLPGPSRRDLGHSVFHKAASPGSPIACASCHPEGREDGRVWAFEDIGVRRTQTVAGGVLDTQPLHWDGEFDSLDGLMTEVFVDRMGGVSPGEPQLEALGGWLNQLPHLKRSRVADEAAITRGEALYWDEKVACGDCHDGSKLTNSLTVDVGTGMALQVPSLVGVMDRAPFMHDGCAPDLRSRFTNPSCGGGDRHGVTSHLSDAEIDDLVAYIETL